jgi:hypothetical protein
MIETPNEGKDPTVSSLTEEEHEDAIADIAYTIAAEVASDWGLWLDDPDTALDVWTSIGQYAGLRARQAATKLLVNSHNPAKL